MTRNEGSPYRHPLAEQAMTHPGESWLVRTKRLLVVSSARVHCVLGVNGRVETGYDEGSGTALSHEATVRRRNQGVTLLPLAVWQLAFLAPFPILQIMLQDGFEALPRRLVDGFPRDTTLAQHFA